MMPTMPRTRARVADSPSLGIGPSSLEGFVVAAGAASLMWRVDGVGGLNVGEEGIVCGFGEGIRD